MYNDTLKKFTQYYKTVATSTLAIQMTARLLDDRMSQECNLREREEESETERQRDRRETERERQRQRDRQTVFRTFFLGAV